MSVGRSEQPPPHVAFPSPYSGYGKLQPRHSTWFWIAVTIGCGFALLSIAALTLPGNLWLKKRADEASAIKTMRAIASAELSYKMTANRYACSLAPLNVDPDLAANGLRNGYFFAIHCASTSTDSTLDPNASYQMTAVPVVLGKTGNRGFCSDTGNSPKFDPNGGTNCTQPYP
jgi:type IV pilus assembly protein PilA